ncbi:MAG TPA: 2-C-methyl-D-erythritol 4-phosphate cytidylyltransferase, partial [Chlamydiales bacterium]|nr:2-C-methyl-D-erythritol 4-phosphate cytidylyltransferase [Chlamydiales bacterium]
GKGTRMENTLPKQYLCIHDKPVFSYSLEPIIHHPSIDDVIVVCDPKYRHFFKNYPVRFAIPGDRRQDSVFSALKEDHESDLICIHDGARPFLTEEILTKLLSAAITYQAAALGKKVTHTIKQLNQQNNLVSLNRETLYEIYTPQVILKPLLMKGYEYIHQKGLTVTDDLSIIEPFNIQPKIITPDFPGIKITHPQDLKIAKAFLS